MGEHLPEISLCQAYSGPIIINDRTTRCSDIDQLPREIQDIVIAMAREHQRAQPPIIVRTEKIADKNFVLIERANLWGEIDERLIVALDPASQEEIEQAAGVLLKGQVRERWTLEPWQGGPTFVQVLALHKVMDTHEARASDFIETIKNHPRLAISFIRDLPADHEVSGAIQLDYTGDRPFSVLRMESLAEEVLTILGEIVSGNYLGLDNLIYIVSLEIYKLGSGWESGLEIWALEQAKDILLAMNKGEAVNWYEKQRLSALLSFGFCSHIFNRAPIQTQEADVGASEQSRPIYFHHHHIGGASGPSFEDRDASTDEGALQFSLDESGRSYGFYFTANEIWPVNRVLEYAEQAITRAKISAGYSTERGLVVGLEGGGAIFPLDVALNFELNRSTIDTMLAAQAVGLIGSGANTWQYNLEARAFISNEGQSLPVHSINYVQQQARMAVISPYFDELGLSVDYRQTRLQEQSMGVALFAMPSIIGFMFKVGTDFRHGFGSQDLVGLSIETVTGMSLLEGLNMLLPTGLTGSFHLRFSGALRTDTWEKNEFTGELAYRDKNASLYWQMQLRPDETRNIFGLNLRLFGHHALQTEVHQIDSPSRGNEYLFGYTYEL